MESYTLEYSVLGSDKIFRETFESKDDREAVTKGRGRFIMKAESQDIPACSTLLAIYRTPKNLLEKKVRLKVDQQVRSSYSLVDIS
jgi:hypothetical protein